MAFNEATKEIPRKFISTEKNHARVLSDDSSVQEARLVVPPGELFHLVCTTDDTQPGQEALILMSLDRANVLMETDTRSVREISNYMAELLLPVDQPRRLGLLADHRQNVRLEEFMQVEHGNNVTVTFETMPYPGVVCYQGPVPDKGPGIWFGVWLIHHAGQGDSDGSVNGKRYFTCNPNCAVFVSVADLVLRHESQSSFNDAAMEDRSTQNYPKNPSQDYNMNGLVPHESAPGKRGKSPAESKTIGNLLHGALNVAANAIGLHKGSQSPRSESSRSLVFVNSNLAPKASTSTPSPPAFQSSGAAAANPLVDELPFKLNGRVCYFEDDCDPQIATVRWIGWLLKESNKDLYVGIEFDKPVGSGTGQFNGDQLFVTKPNHAAFVPATCLFPYEEAREQALAHRTESGPVRVQPQMTKKPSYSEMAKRPPQNSPAGGPSLANAADASRRAIQPAAVLSSSNVDAPKPSSGSSRLAINLQANDPVKPAATSAMTNNLGRNVQPAHASTAYVASKHPERQRVPQVQQASKQEIHKWVTDDKKSAGGFSSTKKDSDLHWPSEKLNSSTVDGTVKEHNIPIQHETSSYRDSYNSVHSGSVPAAQNVSPSLSQNQKNSAVPSSSVSRMSLPTKPVIGEGQQNPMSFYYGMEPKSENSPVGGRLSSRSNLTPSQPVPQLHPASLRRIDDKICSGRKRGIQGHKNSCYLDATLFSMFAFTNVFDEILTRPRRKRDIHGYEEVQHALREAIVHPLRNTMYVPCVDVMHLRELMDVFGNVTGLTNEERDPEEFLTSLFQQILKIDPLLKLTTGDCNWYTLFVEKDQMNLIPAVQQLFDESLVASDVRFKEVPKCLLLQTPRSGAQYKMYRYIFPSAVLDITDAIAGYPRQCSFCQEEQAEFECKECYNWMNLEDKTRSGLSTMAFCKKCSVKRHQRNPKHKPYEIQTTLAPLPEEQVRMELFAVVCIKTSHYVTFAKDGNQLWYFVDSMADREGGEGDRGSNIPEVRPCPELSEYLDPEFGHKRLMEKFEQHQSLPEPMSRFFEDCYFLMYQPITSVTVGQQAESQLVNLNTASEV
ncbi:ubiquitin carboxyl-terminal hydrolase CYLD-like [Paramacrobiotus metropolitanus]|uniref:ubiquitin carboxyl-terminal hydrolase CYLD-like n=1 Tax=Paramacrobiotus metropolitanus TaxID=2943436 RepID=UPI0024464B73|nr:ubiquitin carboxyl-terminal hydrolase CYLD-like [Paramacrobiotus metropolitanus]XP_055337443.1 ubiquitin carboxyl-terminal hydrolase CYLD-like [Paramacrobiotus metropolitanus]